MKSKNIFRTIGIIASWLIAAGIFYGIFFKLSPYIQSLIPASDWKGLADFAIVILLAYCGGIVGPIVVGIFGTVTTVVATE